MADDERTDSLDSTLHPKTDTQERGLNRARDRNRSRSRDRSRSPRRDHDRTDDRDRPQRRKDTGFKWKEKRRDDEPSRDERETTGLQRGYKDRYRPRSRSPRRDETLKETQPPVDLEKRKGERSEKPEKREKKAPAPARPTEPMIIVYVNDRLGTKKAVPCFASDPIKDFKVIVASMIGRQPHEILLKRQGERPFKDMLTLRDYGVSNNVQLDLEVDTGD